MNKVEALPYDVNDNIVQRFYNLAMIATAHDNGYQYEKNKGEKIADDMLWHIEKLPYKIKDFVTDPKVATIALATFAILAVSLTFYPFLTAFYLKEVVLMVFFPPAWAVRLALYLLSVETIVGYTIRAESRFFNQNLLQVIPGYKLEKSE